jgi:hypothetical protein
MSSTGKIIRVAAHLIPILILVACNQEGNVSVTVSDKPKVLEKNGAEVFTRMKHEMEKEYGYSDRALRKTASTSGDIGFLKGKGPCISGEEVRILIDEQDFGVGASTPQEVWTGVHQQEEISRLRWANRETQTQVECGDLSNGTVNYPSFNCLPPLGLEGIQRYPAFQGHNPALDTEFRLCKDNVGYLHGAKYNFAVVALHKNDQEARCGCPYPSHMFSIDFQADWNSASQITGNAGPNFASYYPTDFVRVFFCFREGQGYYAWNPWEHIGTTGKVGVFGSADEHAEPWIPSRDQGEASSHQVVWEIHPILPWQSDKVNAYHEFQFYDCLGEGYWQEDKKWQVVQNLFHTRGVPPENIFDFMIHATWRGPE